MKKKKGWKGSGGGGVAYRVQGIGCRVQGVGCRVLDVGV